MILISKFPDKTKLHCDTNLHSNCHIDTRQGFTMKMLRKLLLITGNTLYLD